MSSFTPQAPPWMTSAITFNTEDGERLKAVGNELYQQRKYVEAIEKYTEAAKANPMNPFVYANRAAAHLAVKEHIDAVFDCEKATSLDPTYAKAWGRLGTALYALGSWDECSSAWRKALECLSKPTLTPAEVTLKRQVEDGLKLAQEGSAKNAESAKLAPEALTARKELETLASRVDERRVTPPSCVFALNYANACFKKANETMRLLTRARGGDDSIAISSCGAFLENMTNAILIDDRVFYADSPHEFYGMVSKQYYIESISCRSLVEGGGVENIKKEILRMLRDEGWESVILAITLTVRYWIFQAHWRFYLYGPTFFSYHLYNRVLEFIQWGKSQWPNTPVSESGTIFKEEISRGVMRLRLQLMQLLLDTKQSHEVEHLFSVQALITAGDELLAATNAQDIPDPREGLPIGHITAFWSSPLVHAYSALGFAHLSIAQSVWTEERYKEKAHIIFHKANVYYKDAATGCAKDDPNYAVLVRKQIECRCYAYRPLREILPICSHLRNMVPKALEIWMPPHEAGIALVNNRAQIQQFQEWCEKEVAAGRMAAGAADRFLMPVSYVYDDIARIEKPFEPLVWSRDVEGGADRCIPVEPVRPPDDGDVPGPSVKRLNSVFGNPSESDDAGAPVSDKIRFPRGFASVIADDGRDSDNILNGATTMAKHVESAGEGPKVSSPGLTPPRTSPRMPSSAPIFFGINLPEQAASQHDASSSHPQPIHLPPLLPAPSPSSLLVPGVVPKAAPALATAELAATNMEHAMQEMSRPLNVTDALGYLDAVKNQFQDSPEVYNHFLDIMKDFKSQVIDTPGVIQRVSELFHGNPKLIQGFNTFLPMGYRIETSADPHDHTITVTTPSGTTRQSTDANLVRAMYSAPSSAPPPSLLSGPGAALTPHPYQVGPGLHAHALPVDPSNFSPGFQQQTTAASFLGNLNGKSNSNANGPAAVAPEPEFNHAIQYLNKIKARYADDQNNTYKQFLDILQTYQREGKNSQDNQVYLQVQMLFKDAPDLIVEFKNFLPDAVPPGQEAMIPMGAWPQPQQPQQLPPSPQPTKKAPPAKRKKRALEKEPTPVPPPPVKAASRQTKKVKHHHIPDPVDSPAFSPHVPPRSPPPPSHIYPPALAQHPQQQLMQPPPHQPAPVDKLMFFDRAKKALESKEVYEEFLKLLSLFSKEIIDLKTLVERAKVFLGEEDLLTEFKDLVGWDAKNENPLEHGPPLSIRIQAPDTVAPQPVDDGEGPSYRRLPEQEVRLACSGRDELCRSVLNDEWVSHPTWASEEAGFVAHKKNSFEEALHKSEEERHEYHVHLEALGRTVALLEPLAARIEDMGAEERAAFRLKPDFGGPSKTLYHRTIKRIYGRDNSAEIIQALQECPSVAVPVVLTRLKLKDEDWKRALREWSRTWREVDSKNFYKSLDHQGISFKQNDKKSITGRHFVADIEAIKAQQVREWEEGNGVQKPNFAKGCVGHQLEYDFSDIGVLQDSLKMVYEFLDRTQVYSQPERKAVEKFLRSFVPKLCNIPEAEFNAAHTPIDGGGKGATEDDEERGQDGVDGPRSGRRSIGSTHSGGQSSGVPANDLRKKLLKTAQEKASRGSATGPSSATTGGTNTRGSNSTAASRAATPSAPERSRLAQVGEDGKVVPDIWIKEAPIASGSDSAVTSASDAEVMRPFFANTTLYTLLRLLQLLYSRLLMSKEIGRELADKKHASLLANQVAIDLGLVDPSGPSVVLGHVLDGVGERPANETSPPNVVYTYLITACEKLFDNEMDQATFEEHMRWFFGTKAYHLFTLDKLITALIKQVQIVQSDHKCQELWNLLQLVQGSDQMTKADVVRYRLGAEKHVGQDEHLYRVTWDREKKCIRVSLVSQDEPTIETDDRPHSRWREYVNTYVMTYPTEWVPPAKPRVSPTFLRRCLQGNEEGSTASKVSREDHTRIRISLPTYKLVYENGCEDYLVRRWGSEEGEMLRERARARGKDRRQARWLSP